ncbi:MAG: flagellar protein FlgN [Clostridia bacterium]|nr:flagellar protein FlgN [Clostridia bacterium]
MEAKDYVQRLNEISAKKLALVEELVLYSRNQKELITGDRLEELEALLSQKQQRMDGIDKLDEQFTIYASRLKSMLSLNSFENLPRYNVPGTTELKALVLKINQKLTELKALEDENIAMVKDEMRDTQDKIKHNTAFKRVTGAYYPAAPQMPSVYFDKKK